MESGLGPEKLWKINQMVAAFLTHAFFQPLYTLSLPSIALGSAWVNYVVIKYSQITIT